MKSDATISHFSNWLGHECFKTFLTFKTEQSGNIQDTVGKTVFKASCCVLPEIPVRAEKPLHKTKENNKEAQTRFNRAEMISLLTADTTSRANHPLLEGRGLLAMGSITGPVLYLKDFACIMLHPGQWKKAAAHTQLPEVLYLRFTWYVTRGSFLTCFFSPLSSFVSGQSLFTLRHRLPAPSHSQVFGG